MALLWIEGFEGFGDTTGVVPAPTGIIGRKYPTNLLNTLRIQPGRYGKCLEIRGWTDHLQSPNLTTNATSIFGMAVKILSSPAGYISLVDLYESTTKGVNFRFNPDRTISACRANNILDTTINTMSLDTWYYFEVKVFTHNSSGTIDIRVNDSNWLSLSGVDTQQSANAYHTAFRIGTTHVRVQFDDIYFLDGSGAINNDFLGPRRVSVIRPDATGDASQWAPDSGTNYDRVNEAELDEDTSYVETGITTNKDLYNYDPTVDLTHVDGIQIMTDAKVTSGSMELQTLTKSGSTEDSDPGGMIISTDYVTVVSVGELNPDTSLPWTTDEIDAAQFGIKAI